MDDYSPEDSVVVFQSPGTYLRLDRFRDWATLLFSGAILALAIVILIHVIKEKEAMEEMVVSMKQMSAAAAQIANAVLSQQAGAQQNR